MQGGCSLTTVVRCGVSHSITVPLRKLSQNFAYACNYAKFWENMWVCVAWGSGTRTIVWCYGYVSVQVRIWLFQFTYNMMCCSVLHLISYIHVFISFATNIYFLHIGMPDPKGPLAGREKLGEESLGTIQVLCHVYWYKERIINGAHLT